jgi:hypothetical protein
MRIIGWAGNAENVCDSCAREQVVAVCTACGKTGRLGDWHSYNACLANWEDHYGKIVLPGDLNWVISPTNRRPGYGYFTALDCENNEYHAIFDTDEQIEPEHCAICGEQIE